MSFTMHFHIPKSSFTVQTTLLVINHAWCTQLDTPSDIISETMSVQMTNWFKIIISVSVWPVSKLISPSYLLSPSDQWINSVQLQGKSDRKAYQFYTTSCLSWIAMNNVHLYCRWFIFQLSQPMVSLSHSSYGMPGLAPLMNVLF